MDCLRGQDVNALMAKSRDRDYDRNTQPFWFRPVIDKNQSTVAILKDNPIALYKSGQFKKYVYIVGFTKDKGSLEYYLQYNRLKNKTTIEEKIAFLIRHFIKKCSNEEIIALFLKIQYFRNNSTNNQELSYNQDRLLIDVSF